MLYIHMLRAHASARVADVRRTFVVRLLRACTNAQKSCMPAVPLCTCLDRRRRGYEKRVWWFDICNLAVQSSKSWSPFVVCGHFGIEMRALSKPVSRGALSESHLYKGCVYLCSQREKTASSWRYTSFFPLWQFSSPRWLRWFAVSLASFDLQHTF